MNHAITLLVWAIFSLAGLVMEVISAVDTFLAGLMTSAHIPPSLQILILIGVAVWLVVLAIRLLGRIFSALIIVLLLLLVMHRMVPGVEVPIIKLPPGMQIPGTVHT